jgi:PAS domain S-box-containing protein
MLASKQPVYIAWGPDLTSLYNDGYLPIVGSKHPTGLGQPFATLWAEIWDDFRPFVEKTLAGEAQWFEDMPIALAGRPNLPLGWFTFSYTALRDDDGRIAGFFCAAVETTQKVISARRETFLAELGKSLLDIAEPRLVMARAAAALGQHLEAHRVGFAQVQLDDKTVVLDACFADGVALLQGAFALDSFGADNVARQRRGETVACDDVLADDRYDATTWLSMRTRAFISVPLIRQGRFKAALYVNFREPHVWQSSEISLVEAVAARTWAAAERARAEDALRALNATLEHEVGLRTAERDRIWRFSQDIQVVIDRRGSIVNINPAGEAILGWGAAEMIGRTLIEFIVPNDRASTADALDHARQAAAASAFDNRLQHKQGGYRWISWVASADEDRVYASGRHVTAEKEQAAALAAAQAALRQAQKMEAMGQLTGGIAHDFNNMLAVVLGSLSLVARRVEAGDATAQRHIANAAAAAQRAAALTQRLLMFSRQQPLRPEIIDVEKLIAGMSELIGHLLGVDIRLTTAFGCNGWRVHVDPNQLENALLNLALNARDAMPQGGQLTIETRQHDVADAAPAADTIGMASGQHVLIVVTDSGAGMAPAVLDKAFDPFFTTKEVGKGTGLGLSQVYGFIKQSGGYVKIDSSPARGTKVTLQLPRNEAPTQLEVTEASAIGLPAGRHDGLILVVDDDHAMRQLAVDALNELGYEALQADGARAALRLIDARSDITLLFTDVVMPDGDGRQLAAAAARRRPDLKLLFMTGFAPDAGTANDPSESPATVIGKPFTLEQLASKLDNILGSP